jgi:hypothetical protein
LQKNDKICLVSQIFKFRKWSFNTNWLKTSNFIHKIIAPQQKFQHHKLRLPRDDKSRKTKLKPMNSGNVTKKNCETQKANKSKGNLRASEE